MAMGKMAAMCEVQSEDRVSRLKHRAQCFHVRLRSRVRLYIDVLRAEEFPGAIAGKVFDHVSEFASAVVALAGIALGIFVGEDRAGGFEYGLADIILRSDQFQPCLL